ncbi:hypothetical protein CQJ30_15315 [Caldibacillus thermoamylovorans]|nr:hypothetical protein CQJ30_15315 [Caldibacillus thermoamylovorans]
MFASLPLYPLQVTPRETGRKNKWSLENANACRNPFKTNIARFIQFQMLPISFNDELLCKRPGKPLNTRSYFEKNSSGFYFLFLLPPMSWLLHTFPETMLSFRSHESLTFQ